MKSQNMGDKSETPTSPTLVDRLFRSPIKILGVEFCPILVPFERRLQTLSIIVFLILFLLFPLITYPIIAYFMFFSNWHVSCAVMIPYFVWMWIDRNTCHQGARSSRFFRSWTIWKKVREYFPVKLVKTADLEMGKNYLFSIHPHGTMCVGMAAFGAQADQMFPGFTFSCTTFTLPYRVPFSRELALLEGWCSAERHSLNYLLSYPGGGRVTVLATGGAPEALDSHPGTNVIHLKEKKGFIKVALQNGSPIVPVFSFGETSVFNQVSNPKGSNLRKFQDWLQKLIDTPPMIFYGRGIFQYTFGMLPNRVPVTVVVGVPIPVEKVVTPSQAQIDDLHLRYMTALVNLFYAHRNEYAPGEVLSII